MKNGGKWGIKEAKVPLMNKEHESEDGGNGNNHSQQVEPDISALQFAHLCA